MADEKLIKLLADFTKKRNLRGKNPAAVLNAENLGDKVQKKLGKFTKSLDLFSKSLDDFLNGRSQKQNGQAILKFLSFSGPTSIRDELEELVGALNIEDLHDSIERSIEEL